jgi:hypothetical protein
VITTQEVFPALADPAVMATLATSAPWVWRNAGVDELVFFRNNLPPTARAEIFLPSIDVEYVMLLRGLRHAPPTVRPVDDHTRSRWMSLVSRTCPSRILGAIGSPGS